MSTSAASVETDQAVVVALISCSPFFLFCFKWLPECLNVLIVLCEGLVCLIVWWLCYIVFSLECLAVLTVLLASLTTFVGTLSAAKILHQHILYNVMRTPVSFFDITPVGRILNRLTKDVDTLDNVLPMTLRGWANCFFSVRNGQGKQKSCVETSLIWVVVSAKHHVWF